MASRLSESVSPYLLAHADNPVDWFPWGAAAFAEAARRDVPVLVSIGYSTCHWCHVMARESFSDPETAEELNAGFVAIKVDREEHPDVDAAYMAAAAAFTDYLGWPLTVFVTPDGHPFSAGTYLPPEPRLGLPSFRQVLRAVREAWTERREQIDQTGSAVAEALAQVAEAEPDSDSSSLPTMGEVADAARTLLAREDNRFGGFTAAPGGPKFPIATALRFLQSRAINDEEPRAAEFARRTLSAMARSSLRDPVEGGFFRYATRADWTAPHYERMLTDNAQLLDVAVDAGDVETARGVAAFLLDVLRRPSGGFGAAQDSESWIDGERSEGGYYARDAAGRVGLAAPAVDGKIVTGWNGLAIGALARAGSRLGEPAWIEAARRAADDVLTSNVRPDGSSLLRASLGGVRSAAVATLADYGQLASGLFALALATGEVEYAVRARELVDRCVREDSTIGVAGDPVLVSQGLAAPAGSSDGDEPSGEAAAADAALWAWWLGAGEEYRLIAERLVSGVGPLALDRPIAYGATLQVAAALATMPRQIVVVTPNAEDAEDELVHAARGLSADVIAVVEREQATEFAAAGFTLFEEKQLRDGRSTAYDCRAFVCRLPVTDAASLAR